MYKECFITSEHRNIARASLLATVLMLFLLLLFSNTGRCRHNAVECNGRKQNR